ncbi:MAG: hypothetical protein GEU74_01655 [Nitriliruptorales bacterium]|nr:hypothetical protein [Nitriliruptorales bacterium]
MAVNAELRRNATLVGFAGVAFFAMQAAAGALGRPMAPDELRLLSTDTIPGWTLRLVPMLLSSGALVIAFRAWVRPAGRVAAAAAGVFAVTWLPVATGSLLATPLYTALGTVAASGFVTRWLVERDRGALAAMGVAVALVAWSHTPVAVGATTALVGVSLVWGRTSAGPAVAAVLAGAFAGAAVSAAAPVSALRWVETAGTRWWLPTVVAAAATTVVVAIAVVEQRWPHRRNAAVVAVTVAAGALVAVASMNPVTPVTLLTVHAALSVSAGSGALAAWHAVRRMSTPLATVGLVAAAAAFVIVQLTFAISMGEQLRHAPDVTASAAISGD